MSSTQYDVIRLIAQVLEQPAQSVGPKDRFIEHLGASSLDVVTLIMEIENHFDLAETPDAHIERIETVQDLIDLVDIMRSGDPSPEATDIVDIAIGSDHAAVGLKAHLVEWLRKERVSYIDLGPNHSSSVDYPDFAKLVCDRVIAQDARMGILLCGSGIGMSIAANKIKGVRAALVSSALEAQFARQHNDANVLCLGARMIGTTVAESCTDAFLHTRFTPGDDGRHRRRIQMLDDL